MKIVIIDYGAGNVFSVKNALNFLGYEPEITDDPDQIRSADKVIFPGVGAAPKAMTILKNKNLDQVIPKLEQPVLGICLGMQLMFDLSEEGHQEGIHLFSGMIKKFDADLNIQIPHMGWNKVMLSDSILWRGIQRDPYFYFVHSYFLPLHEHSIGNCLYGSEFTAAVSFQNFYGVQFHPEKSDKDGLQVLQNFIELT